ncbi:hypothetical protein AB0C02_30935 [Micromonospora sp. NPDC048999]|uniref:hypothetical protein n=1 Tax=Micromonospora sp. NPDC048999 TaxID=3155391 RepID=UPI0033EC89F6
MFAPIGTVALATVPALMAWAIDSDRSTPGAVTLRALGALPRRPLLVLNNSGRWR